MGGEGLFTRYSKKNKPGKWEEFSKKSQRGEQGEKGGKGTRGGLQGCEKKSRMPHRYGGGKERREGRNQGGDLMVLTFWREILGTPRQRS